MRHAGQARPPSRVLVAMGTRPEVIKLFPVVRALERLGTCEPVVCATGQHRELLDQTLEHFSLRPLERLDVMRPGQSPAGIAGRLLLALTGVFDRIRPEYVVVQGDTTAALATGMAASYAGLPVAHVEAGLRTGDPAAPFPEETNRRLLAALTTLHFAPTRLALKNLLGEGVSRESIHVTGNTVIDTLHWALDRSGERRHSRQHHSPDRRRAVRPHVLVTAHRRESIRTGLASTATAILALAERRPGVDFTWPLHPNPRVQLALSALRTRNLPNVNVCDPLPYCEFVRCMARSTLVVTDSGGVQEEAPALGVPVVVAGEKTSRQEGLEHGIAVTAGTAPEAIIRAAEAVLDAAVPPDADSGLYGDGRAAERIATVLTRELMLPMAATG